MFSHNKCNLGTLFGTPLDTKTLSYFQVPKYQRKFDWEKEKQVSKLIEDIYQNMGKSYFMGPIIICSRSGTKGNFVELIDGQQRLATFAIFIRSLIDYIEHRRTEPSFPQNLVESMFRIKFELESKLLKGSQQNEVVIHLPRKINSFFRTEIMIKNDNDRAGSLEKAKRGQHPSVKRLVDAYIKVWESLKEKYDDKSGELLLVELTNLKDSLLNEKEFLVLTVQDEGDAYTIFETINERAKLE